MYSTVKDENVQNLKKDAYTAANDAKSTLSDTANRAGHKVREFIDNASEEFSHAKETVSAQIKEKPVQSSLIALGIGAVLGMLLARR